MLDSEPIIATRLTPGQPAILLADEAGLAFATVLRDRAEQRARRLVACWNACLGIATEDLEDVARGEGRALVLADAVGVPPPTLNGIELSEDLWEQRWTIAEEV